MFSYFFFSNPLILSSLILLPCLRAVSSSRSPLVARNWQVKRDRFSFSCVSSPPYCMMELSVAMVTVVANSNSTVEMGLLVALACCWSWVGMKKGINPPFLFAFPGELDSSIVSVFLVRCCSETDWKHSHHLPSQATSASPVSSQPLVKDPQ